MMWLNRLLLALALASPLSTAGLRAQDANQPPAEPTYEFFSGTIVQFSEAKLTVSRSVLGRGPENRDFVINPDTKVEGKLRNKARVTVGFIPTESGDPVAVRVIVRNNQQKK